MSEIAADDRWLGFSNINSLVIRQHLLPDMVQPVRLYKKVPLVYLSHILVATSVTTFVMYPVLPEFLQSEFDRYVGNLVTVGESIQKQLDSLSDNLLYLLKWAHRDQTIYP